MLAQVSINVFPFPRSNQRCFLNGILQSGVFRGWPGCARAEGRRTIENIGVFGHFCPSEKVYMCRKPVRTTPFETLKSFRNARDCEKHNKQKKNRFTGHARTKKHKKLI